MTDSKQKINRDRKIAVASKPLPVASNGDVQFESYEQMRTFFDEEEVTLIVERWIRNSAASKEANKKSAAKNREMLRPVKAAAKTLFPDKAFADLTSEEYAQAVDAAYSKSAEA